MQSKVYLEKGSYWNNPAIPNKNYEKYNNNQNIRVSQFTLEQNIQTPEQSHISTNFSQINSEVVTDDVCVELSERSEDSFYVDISEKYEDDQKLCNV